MYDLFLICYRTIAVVYLILFQENVTEKKLMLYRAFYTRAYPFITELRNKFYRGEVKGNKAIPLGIYELLSPPGVGGRENPHPLLPINYGGDGSIREYGLEICTDCYSLADIIQLYNVLVIRYQLTCTIRLKRENQYRIDIYLLNLCRN
jgi:hypothetical protein